MTWHTSSYSGQDERCVEVAEDPPYPRMRDSQHPHLGHLAFETREWAAFLAEVRGGRL